MAASDGAFLCSRGKPISEADQQAVELFAEFLRNKERHTHHYVPVRDGRLSNGEPSFIQLCVCGARP